MSLQNSHQISDVKIMLVKGADGNGIMTIEKTGEEGLTDIYTITYSDGNRTTFTVTNGASGGMSALFLITSEEGSEVSVTSPSGRSLPVTQITGQTIWKCETTEYGEHTISSVQSGITESETVDVDTCQIYNVSIYHFVASITVTFPEDAICTCGIEGETPQTASSTPYTFYVGSAGTYVVTATDGINTATQNVVITTNGQEESLSFSFIPDGATVTPVNDVQTLLHCADIWDKSYTTIGEVISDTTTFQIIVNSTNAVDYLVRSTSFASSICANQSAMTYVGANNYASNTLLANSTWRTAICNSSYFEKVLNVKIPVMTSATTPSGQVTATAYETDYYPYHAFDFSTSEAWIPVWHPEDYGAQWITYAFPATKKIYKYTMAMYTEYSNGLDSAVLQGSTNNSSFANLANVSGKWSTKTGIISGNITAYRYYRLYIGKNNSSKSYRIYYIQLYGRQNV